MMLPCTPKYYKIRKNCRTASTRHLIKFSKASELSKELSKYTYNKYKISKNVYVKLNSLNHRRLPLVHTDPPSTPIQRHSMGTRPSWTPSSPISIWNTTGTKIISFKKDKAPNITSSSTLSLFFGETHLLRLSHS